MTENILDEFENPFDRNVDFKGRKKEFMHKDVARMWKTLPADPSRHAAWIEASIDRIAEKYKFDKKYVKKAVKGIEKGLKANATIYADNPKGSCGLQEALLKIGIQVMRYAPGYDYYQNKGEKTLQRLSDTDRNIIRNKIERGIVYRAGGRLHPLTYTAGQWKAALEDLLTINTVDPMLEYFDRIKEVEPTYYKGKKVTLKNWLKPFGIDNNELNHFASDLMFRVPTVRAFNPGTHCRIFPVLVGPVDIGKTSILSAMVPHFVDSWQWMYESINLGARLKRNLAGKRIIEIPEMTSLTRMDPFRIASILTERLDNFGNPRTDLTVGTANPGKFLSHKPAVWDRFVPIICRKGFYVEKYMAEHRDSLWRQAVEKYEDDTQPIRLPGHLHDSRDKALAPYILPNRSRA